MSLNSMNDPSGKSLRLPAIFLLLSVGLCLVTLAVGMLFDLSVINVSLNQSSRPYLNAQTRIAYAIIIAMFNVWIAQGAWQMLRLGNYKLAKQAAVFACIPCVGPCFFVGIPFGIWALVLLAKPTVQQSFANPPK